VGGEKVHCWSHLVNARLDDAFEQLHLHSESYPRLVADCRSELESADSSGGILGSGWRIFETLPEVLAVAAEHLKPYIQFVYIARAEMELVALTCERQSTAKTQSCNQVLRLSPSRAHCPIQLLPLQVFSRGVSGLCNHQTDRPRA
jgi:hypothetical protein